MFLLVRLSFLWYTIITLNNKTNSMPILGEKDKSESASRRNIGLIAMAVAVIVGLPIYLAWPGGLSYRPLGQQQPSRPDIRSLPPVEQQKRVAEIIKEGDIKECGAVRGIIIGGSDYYEVCRNNIAMNSASETLDVSLCDQVIDGQTGSIEDCKTEVTVKKLQQQNDIKVCDNAPLDFLQSCRALYWTNQALGIKDVRLCDNISDQKMKRGCRDHFFVEQLILDPQEVKCSQLSKDLQSDCAIFALAVTSSNKGEQYCGMLETQKLSQACFDKAANIIR